MFAMIRKLRQKRKENLERYAIEQEERKERGEKVRAMRKRIGRKRRGFWVKN